jgi:hypothetical protein
MVPGRLDDSPAMIRPTNPIECTIAEFWKVVIIGPGTPRVAWQAVHHLGPESTVSLFSATRARHHYRPARGLFA